ncbi:MAG: phage/plasmid primase, P4 family [Thermodesulfobacteriota bacterium]|nr:phage/plasmid primase, P4 family [Thermodesulfobacteriota bacterium]
MNSTLIHFFFNCKNGTLDLRTSELKDHRIEDFLTKQSPINYNADAKCPIWDGFVKHIMGNSQDKIAFLQKIIGYSLTGIVNEQCLFILYGTGANGKSTMIETIREILGNYAMNVSSNTLLSQNFLSIRNDIARLNGPRFVSAAEIPMGRKLDETLVKQLTGGENVTSRFLYKEVFEYKPLFKLFLTTNHKPEIQGVDNGIWRRIYLVPFDVSVPDEKMDKELPSKLKSELEGILAWAVRGYIEWQKRGLDVPDEVRRATAHYRKEMDQLDGFFEDECTIGSGNRISLADAYSEYIKWSDLVCQDPVGKNAFGNLMKQRGFSQSKSGGVRYWIGLKKKSVTSTS